MFVYGKSIVKVHSGHLNECEPAPGGCQLVANGCSRQTKPDLYVQYYEY